MKIKMTTFRQRLVQRLKVKEQAFFGMVRRRWEAREGKNEPDEVKAARRVIRKWESLQDSKARREEERVMHLIHWAEGQVIFDLGEQQAKELVGAIEQIEFAEVMALPLKAGLVARVCERIFSRFLP